VFREQLNVRRGSDRKLEFSAYWKDLCNMRRVFRQRIIKCAAYVRGAEDEKCTK
jgi:hypothetical protein